MTNTSETTFARNGPAENYKFRFSLCARNLIYNRTKRMGGKKDQMILKPSLMYLPLNDQSQCKTASHPPSPRENMLGISEERNPAHP